MFKHLTAQQAAQITLENKPGDPKLGDVPAKELMRFNLKKTINNAAYKGYERIFIGLHKDDAGWLRDLGFTVQEYSKDDEEINYLNERLNEENERLVEFIKRLDEKIEFLQVIFNARTVKSESFQKFFDQLSEQFGKLLSTSSFIDSIVDADRKLTIF